MRKYGHNKRNYISIWNYIQRFAEYQIYKRKRVSAFIIDETIIQICSQHFWLWFCIATTTRRNDFEIKLMEEMNIS